MENTNTNEPHGLNENQENHQTRFAKDDNTNQNENVAVNNQDLAGNAAGNTLDEGITEGTGIAGTDISGEDSPVIKGKGFMGDFSEPQHDDGNEDEQYDERTDNNL